MKIHEMAKLVSINFRVTEFILILSIRFCYGRNFSVSVAVEHKRHAG